MDSSVLQKQFARMGARLKVREGPMPWRIRAIAGSPWMSDATGTAPSSTSLPPPNSRRSWKWSMSRPAIVTCC